MISIRLAPPRATVVPKVCRSPVERHLWNPRSLARCFEARPGHPMPTQRQSRSGYLPTRPSGERSAQRLASAWATGSAIDEADAFSPFVGPTVLHRPLHHLDDPGRESLPCKPDRSARPASSRSSRRRGRGRARRCGQARRPAARAVVGADRPAPRRGSADPCHPRRPTWASHRSRDRVGLEPVLANRVVEDVREIAARVPRGLGGLALREHAAHQRVDIGPGDLGEASLISKKGARWTRTFTSNALIVAGRRPARRWRSMISGRRLTPLLAAATAASHSASAWRPALIRLRSSSFASVLERPTANP